MRRRKTDLPARVNGNLPFEFDDVALTSYAGLELFARYLRRIGFNQLVRHAFAGTPAWGDFGVVAMVRVVIGLIVVGGRRLRHLTYVADDGLPALRGRAPGGRAPGADGSASGASEP